MTNKFELYKCNICGNIIEILISGDGHPICCGEEMSKIEVKNDSTNSPSLTEKHAPDITYNNEMINISVLNHPMEKEHYIMFLQAVSEDDNEACIKYFHPGQDAKISVNKSNLKNIKARSFCNIHGLYVND